MANLDNVHLWKTPFTEKIEFVSVNSKNIVVSRRNVDENEILGILKEIIDYLHNKGIDTITNTKTGEIYLFRKELAEERKDD